MPRPPGNTRGGDIDLGTGLKGDPITTIGDAPAFDDTPTNINRILDILLGSTRGSVAYRGALAWTALPPSTDGFVLETHGPGADPTWAAGPTGGLGVFGFAIGGLMKASELLGIGVWAHDIVWTNGNPEDVIEALSPASSGADLLVVVGGGTVGTIHFPAGSPTGTVSWSGSPYTLPAGTPMLLYAPAPADPSLTLITAIVNGSRA